MLVGVAALSGCTGHSSCQAPCTVAIAHLAVVNQHLAIPLEADGKVVEAVMDTGASQSVLTKAGADLLNARVVHSSNDSAVALGPVVASGVGGETTGELLTVGDLKLAGGHLRDASFVGLPSLRFRDPRLTGLVGGDLLQNWDLDLDVGRNLVNLDLPQTTSPLPPWHDPTTRVPLEDQVTKLIKISVMLDGHPVEAIVDTGASRSVLSGNTAAGAEAAPGDKLVQGSGIAGIRTPMRRHHFSDLSIGGLSFGPVDVGVSETPNAVPGADMLIGLDVLRMARVYVAYQAGVLLIDEGGS